MNQTDSYLVVLNALEAYLNTRIVELGIKKVWYGNDNLIPETPAINLVPTLKRRVIAGTGAMTENTINVNITIFHSRLENPQVTRKECDALAEQVEGVLHENKHLDGLVIFSYVSEMEPGVASRNNVMMRATRLGWTASSKTRI